MSRINIQIFLGSLLILATSVVMVVYGLNEEQRMEETRKAVQARSIEEGAALFEQQCSRCHGTQGTGIPGLCPPLNDRYFYDQRLTDIGWSSTLEDYIVATASGGRLTSTRPETYPGQGIPAMPSFSDQFGGPLREDQIRNIAAFVMNWEPTAQLVEAPSAPSGPPVGSDITKQLPTGDPANGEALSLSLGCQACHVTTPTGPAWPPSGDQPGVGERAVTRIDQADYTGKATTPEQYLFESIAQPNAFIVSGYAQGLMPGNYADTLTDQDMADLIAYLLTVK